MLLMTEFTEYTLDVLAIVIVLLPICVVFLRYLDGFYNYTEFVQSSDRYRVTTKNAMGGTREYDVIRYVIKREYHNGRIEFISKEVNA